MSSAHMLAWQVAYLLRLLLLLLAQPLGLFGGGLGLNCSLLSQQLLGR